MGIGEAGGGSVKGLFKSFSNFRKRASSSFGSGSIGASIFDLGCAGGVVFGLSALSGSAALAAFPRFPIAFFRLAVRALLILVASFELCKLDNQLLKQVFTITVVDKCD